MRRYTDLFIDFDDTLYDTHSNANVALENLFAHFHLDKYFEKFEDFQIPYWKTNIELWDQYSQGDIDRAFLIVERFRRPLMQGKDALGNPADISGKRCLELNDYFLDQCSSQGKVVDGAREVLEYLKERGYKLHLCSNGFHEIQYKKLKSSRLESYFDHIVLSEDAGANKPGKAFFDYAFKVSGASAETTLMIGDNFKTDMTGAKGAGIDTMFFNRHPEEFRAPAPVNYEIHSLQEIFSRL